MPTFIQILTILTSAYLISCGSGKKNINYKNSFENIIINTSTEINENKWIKGHILKEGNKIKVKIRRDKDVQTLKIKAKEQYWKRFKSFYIKFNEDIKLLNEWVYHKMLLNEGILSTRYNIARLILNNNNEL